MKLSNLIKAKVILDHFVNFCENFVYENDYNNINLDGIELNSWVVDIGEVDSLLTEEVFDSLGNCVKLKTDLGIFFHNIVISTLNDYIMFRKIDKDNAARFERTVIGRTGDVAEEFKDIVSKKIRAIIGYNVSYYLVSDTGHVFFEDGTKNRTLIDSETISEVGMILDTANEKGYVSVRINDEIFSLKKIS